MSWPTKPPREVGGVVPEWASRAHLEKIHPVVQAALDKAVTAQDWMRWRTPWGRTQGSLHVGTSFAKAYAWALGVPSIPVHHMRAHVLAHVLEPEPSPKYPFLCLTVSGGHTQLVKVSAPGDMEVLGQTLDDAAGEAFDKVAKLMGLPYPGGPVVDRLAQQGDPEAFAFSRPRMEGLNWSFSGLKTQVLHFEARASRRPDVCRAPQSGHLRLCSGDHLGHVVRPLDGRRDPIGHPRSGHRRWGQCQFWPARQTRRARTDPWVERVRAAICLLHRQRRHGRGCGVA